MKNEPIVIAGCLIEKDEKFLLVQEAKPKAYGLWNIPAGHVDAGESIEQAAVRESKEESGFDVTIQRKIGTYMTGNNHEINVFTANIVGGELAFPADEILDAGWFTRADIELLEASERLRDSYLVAAVSEYVKPISSND